MAGETPFFLSPLAWGAKKILGSKKVDKAVWKYFQAPIVKADVALGEQAQRLSKAMGGSGKLFSEAKVLPMSKARGKFTGGKEVLVPSFVAPAGKAGKIVIPMLGMMKAEELLKKEKKMDQPKNITQADLTKTAEMLESLKGQRDDFEKKAHATKLLFKQAELGQIVFPKSHDDFEEKVAKLMHKDLNVVEEAIKMAAASEELVNTFGGLSSQKATDNPMGGSAQNAFQKSLM